jgi:hypothetical protein
MRRALSSAVTQVMNRAKVFFGQSCPTFPIDGRPKITGKAPAQMLAVVVNFGQSLMTLITAFGSILRHHDALTTHRTHQA